MMTSSNKAPAADNSPCMDTLDPWIRDEVLDQFTEHFHQSPGKLLTARLDKLLFYQLVQGGDVDRVSTILQHVRLLHPDWYNYILTGRVTPMSDKTKKQPQSNNSGAIFEQFKGNSADITKQACHEKVAKNQVGLNRYNGATSSEDELYTNSAAGRTELRNNTRRSADEFCSTNILDQSPITDKTQQDHIFYGIPPKQHIEHISTKVRTNGETIQENPGNISRPPSKQAWCISETPSEPCSQIDERMTWQASTSPERYSKIISWLVYAFVMIPLFVITTPIFYILHHLFLCSHHAKNRTRGRIRLPLTFATFSNCPDMVRLFARHHPSILRCSAAGTADDEGSNVFHYLAEISRKNAQRSISCAELLMNVFGIDETREVMTTMRNSSGMTALELAVHIGSPLYFTHLLERPGILKAESLRISNGLFYCSKDNDDEKQTTDENDSISLRTLANTAHNNKEMDETVPDADLGESRYLSNVREDTNADALGLQNFSPSTVTSPGFQLDRYDLTRYERGDVGADSSFLLALFAFRDLMKMTKNEVDTIVKSLVLTQWMRIKIKGMERTKNILRSGEYFIMLLCGYEFFTTDDVMRASNLIIQFWQTMETLAAESSISFPSTLSLDADVNGSLAALVPATVASLSLLCNFNVSSNVSNWTANTGFAGANAVVLVLPSIIFLIINSFIILSDLAFRLSFLTRHYFFDGWATGSRFRVGLMLRRVFSRPMPISYVGRLLSIQSATYYLCMSWSSSYLTMAAVSPNAIQDMYLQHTLMMIFAVLGTCMRYFSYLYSLRYRSFLNTASHFVLTLVRMASCVIEFSVVYLGVLFFFTTIFMLVVRDPACPANPDPLFASWTSSVPTLFKLMLTDNKLPEQMTPDLLLLYLIYAVMTTIVMLGLITGMTAGIANQVLSKRMLEIMLSIESLKDAIDAETYMSIVLFPIFKSHHRQRLEREKKIALETDKKGEIVKVLIELENVPN